MPNEALKMVKRADGMVAYGMAFIGTKYVWGGDDAHDGGMDCSGFAQEVLRSAGLWGRADATAQGLYTALVCQGWQIVESDQLVAGDFLFYGDTRQSITHVALGINSWQVLEAGGGDRTNSSGMVRIRPTSWRKDCCVIIRPPNPYTP